MSDTNCGCDQPADNTKAYLMVEATASEASTCKPNLNQSGGSESCPKQEPVYDSFNSGFIVPLPNNTITVGVCNPDVYSVGQWIQTLNSPTVTMRIVSIVDGGLVLSNGCINGAELDENPSAGTAVVSGSRFSIVGEPPCLTDAEKANAISEALAASTALCMPSLEEATDTAVVQMVGRVESDPGSTSFTRCIRRVKGFLMKGGTPVLSRLTTRTTNFLQFRRLGKDKTTHSIMELLNYHEYPEVVSGKQYLLAMTTGTEKPRGPAYIPTFFRELIHQNSTSTNPTTWPSTAASFSQTFNLNSIPQISSLDRALNHYYAMVHITVGIWSNNSAPVGIVTLNNEGNAMRLYNQNHDATGFMQFNTVCLPIRIADDGDLEFNLSVTTSCRFYFRIMVQGVYY